MIKAFKSKMSSTTDFPTELVATVKDFQTGIANVERVLKPMLDVPLTQLQVSTSISLKGIQLSWKNKLNFICCYEAI